LTPHINQEYLNINREVRQTKEDPVQADGKRYKSESENEKFFKLFVFDDSDQASIAKVLGWQRKTVDRKARIIRQVIAKPAVRGGPFQDFSFEAAPSADGDEFCSASRSASSKGVFALVRKERLVFTIEIPDPLPSNLAKFYQWVHQNKDQRGIAHVEFVEVYRGANFRRIQPDDETIRVILCGDDRQTNEFKAYTSKRLKKCRGLSASNFRLHLYESELRFQCERGRNYKLFEARLRPKLHSVLDLPYKRYMNFD
jgi:hypothetical protein